MAGAGYGKTTLVSQWIERFGHPSGEGVRSAIERIEAALVLERIDADLMRANRTSLIDRDIFKVKEVIADRVCIYGDVPANLLSLGSPTEVDEYCHRLIEEVGKGRGFILGSGCELAPNAKPENVKAMCESVVKYGYYDTQMKAA